MGIEFKTSLGGKVCKSLGQDSAWRLPHVLTWRMGVIVGIVEPLSSAGHEP